MGRRLKLLGIIFIAIGLVFLGGSAYAYTIYAGGKNSLQKFSEIQKVELSYDDQGNLLDHGDAEAGKNVIKMVKDDWGYPLSDAEMDRNDPLVNTASEYMVQMATITGHVIHGTYPVTLTAEDLKDKDGNPLTEITCNGTKVAVPNPVPAEGVTCDFKAEGRYWTGFDRTDPVQAKAREAAWTGTAHGLIGELGVGAATASTLKLALGVVALLAGLGLINILAGLGMMWIAGGRDERVVEA